ncbi:MAG TPA: c-type cytochrome [Terriglobales bacterium]
MPKRVLLCLGVVLVLAGAVAMAQQPDTQYHPGPKLDPAAVARGQKLFITNCSFCHAADATGASGPDLLRSPIVLRDQHGETIGVVVHAGRPGAGGGPSMPAFSSLTESQIGDIAEFLHSRVVAAADRFDYPITGVMTGNAAAGAAYFNGAGKCSTCHTVSDTAPGTMISLAGIAGRFTPPNLLKRIAYPAPARGAIDETAAETVKVTLPSGATVSGVLIHQGEFHVVLRDADGWQRTFTLGPGVQVAVHDPLAFHKQQIGKYSDAELHNLLAYLETLK